MSFRETLNRVGRSKHDRMLGGVCAGFAQASDTPAWLWRAGFLFVALGYGAGVLLYIVLWIVMPEQK